MVRTPEPLLVADDLWRCYRRGGRAGGGRASIQAVRGVSLAVARGEALAVVGRSGSGKSTLARLLLALEPPDRGTVCFDGHNLFDLPAGTLRALRRRFQAVFQDPSASLDPCLRVATIIGEPLAAHGDGGGAQRRARVAELLRMVGMPPEAAALYPDQFSGGQRQRIAIARAVACEPELLILDEPLSSLDAPVQLRILGLVADLRRRLGLALLLITHDLAVARSICGRALVMEDGEIVESGAASEVLSRPRHPATRALAAAARI